MHKLVVDEPGKQMLLLGNEAIARGALEAGVACATTYPGTPSSEISQNFFEISGESDLYFEYSTNEKVALEVAAAAANAGLRSMCVMKHVGLNVAADALMTLAYIGVKAGLVVVSADDPFMFSSQNEQDNRYYGKMAGLCMLEPSCLQEAKEMAAYGFDLSERLGEPVLLRTTTRINHCTEKVTLGPIRPRQIRGSFAKDPFHLVAIPAVSRALHTRLLERLREAEALSCASPYNFRQGAGPWGIVCNGVSYGYVCDALKDLAIEDKVNVLRIGFSNPMPTGPISEFCRGVEKILVVEEGEAFMEEAVRSIAQQAGVTIPIKGKSRDLFTPWGEFDPAMVREKTASFFGVPVRVAPRIDLSDVAPIAQRPPNLCAGCPHRATFYEVKQAAGDAAQTLFPTDIGCYTLGLLPPLSAADFLLCMGSSVGTGCGFSRFTDKKVVSFIGDSTFFHSGVPGLINAVYNNHDFTLVILDNGTTAMTGHQPHPGVDMADFGRSGYGKVTLEGVARGVGVEHVTVIDPYKVNKSVEAIREALDHKGISVVIARQVCPLYTRGRKIVKKRPFRITEKCRNHRVCVDQLACPAMYVEKEKVRINPNLCTGCAVCAQVCPENAIVPVKQ